MPPKCIQQCLHRLESRESIDESGSNRELLLQITFCAVTIMQPTSQGGKDDLWALEAIQRGVKWNLASRPRRAIATSIIGDVDIYML